MPSVLEQAKKAFIEELDAATELQLSRWREHISKIGIEEKGGPGSGHRGHAGRPGKRGGSVPGTSSVLLYDMDPDDAARILVNNQIIKDFIDRDAFYEEGSHGEEFPYALAEDAGFTALPTLVSSDELDTLLEDGSPELFRALNNSDHMVQMATGDYHTGIHGALGAGIYFGDWPELASQYGTYMARGTIARDARIVPISELQRKGMAIYDSVNAMRYNTSGDEFAHLSRIKDAMDVDLTATATMLGIDGYFEQSESSGRKIYIIANRGKLILENRITEISDVTIRPTGNYIDLKSMYDDTIRHVEASRVLSVIARDYTCWELVEFYRRYVNGEPLNSIIEEKQLPIDDNSKAALLQARKEIFWDTSDQLAEQVYTGEISIGQWQETMKSEIRNLYTSSASIGKGGWDTMGPRDWGRLGTPLREQYRYLQGFAEKISNDRDTISFKQIRARARLYGEAGGQAAVQVEAGFPFEELLPWLPKDDSTICHHRCHCRWLQVVVGFEGNEQIVHSVWQLGDADHCETCKGRQGHTEINRVPIWMEIPQTIGGY